MITIIHGSDTVSSRKFFLEEKEKYHIIQIIDGEKITLTDLTQIFEGGGLFEENKTVFIEHFFNRKKRKDEFTAFAAYLQKHASHTVYLWEGKELEKSSLTVFKTATPRVFKLPQTLFVFLDNFKPGNGQQLIRLFHQTLETTDPEMIFFMLIRQVRLLLALAPSLRDHEVAKQSHRDRHVAIAPRDDKNESIDELKRLAPWQKTKLSQQAQLFEKDTLITIYQKLFLIETGQKTGSLSNTILTNIDFLLAEI